MQKSYNLLYLYNCFHIKIVHRRINKVSKNGYQILSYKNSPFALTKVSNNTFKKHYPKGLRKNIEK